jgi:hypothetical protein
MINFASKQPNNPKKAPELIFSPQDLTKLMESDLPKTTFLKGEYKEVAALLEKLAIVERRAEAKLSAWKNDPEAFSKLTEGIDTEKHAIRKKLHDIFLSEHDYPNGPQMILMPSDVHANKHSVHLLKFRDEEMDNLAGNIEVLVRFERELETYLTNQHGMGAVARQEMIRNTQEQIRAAKEHLTYILTGYSS